MKTSLKQSLFSNYKSQREIVNKRLEDEEDDHQHFVMDHRDVRIQFKKKDEFAISKADLRNLRKSKMRSSRSTMERQPSDLNNKTTNQKKTLVRLPTIGGSSNKLKKSSTLSKFKSNS